MTEIGLAEFFAKLFEGGITFPNVLIGGSAIAIIVVALIVTIRCIREKISPMEALGFRNGYLKEAEFRTDMAELKETLRDHKASINVRFDKLEKADAAIRGAVQDIDRKVATIEGRMEQFPSK